MIIATLVLIAQSLFYLDYYHCFDDQLLSVIVSVWVT